MQSIAEVIAALERLGEPPRPPRTNQVLEKFNAGVETFDLLWCYGGGHVFARPETRGVKPYDCERHGIPRAVPPRDPSGAGYELLRFAHDAVTIPVSVRSVVDCVVALVPELARTVDPAGGVVRASLRSVLAPAVRDLGLSELSASDVFGGSEVDYVDRARGVALSVQTGRAASNNSALLALLGASSLRDVEWAVVVVPNTYKGSNTFDAVVRQFRQMAVATGVRLSLQGAFLVSF